MKRLILKLALVTTLSVAACDATETMGPQEPFTQAVVPDGAAYYYYAGEPILLQQGLDRTRDSSEVHW